MYTCTHIRIHTYACYMKKVTAITSMGLVCEQRKKADSAHKCTTKTDSGKHNNSISNNNYISGNNNNS